MPLLELKSSKAAVFFEGVCLLLGPLSFGSVAQHWSITHQIDDTSDRAEAPPNLSLKNLVAPKLFKKVGDG
jgi:hypothetical protein